MYLLQSYYQVGAVLLDAIGLIALAVFVLWPRIEKFSPESGSLLMGVLLAAVAALQVLTPIEIAPGVIVDLRCLPIGLAAAFFGFRPAMVGLVLVGGLRIWIGGVGAFPGLVSLILAVAGGLLWAYLSRRSPERGPVWLALLGLLISTHIFAGLLLPGAVRVTFFETCAPVMLVLNVLGALTAGGLIEHRMRHLRWLKQHSNSDLVDQCSGLMTRAGFEANDKIRWEESPVPTSIGAIHINLRHLDWLARIHGASTVNRVIATLARRLICELRPGDLAIRASDGEFAVVMTDISQGTLAEIRDQLQVSLGGRPVGVPSAGPVRVSVDVAMAWQPRSTDVHPVMQQAREALGAASQSAPPETTAATSSGALYEVAEKLIANRHSTANPEEVNGKPA